MRLTRQDALRLLEQAMGVAPHALRGEERLQALEAWDSLSTMLFIALADKHFGLPLPGSRVAACRTVDELLGLLGPALAGRAA
jgi:hypothetical protein